MRHGFQTVLLAALIMLSGCARPTTSFPTVSSAEVEREMAEQLSMLQEIKATKMASQSERLERIGPNILEAGDHLCRQWLGQSAACQCRIQLADSDEINAYANQAERSIIITLGMMELMSKDDEVGVILGHEYAHLMLEHTSSKQANMTVGAILGAVLDGLAKAQGYETQSTFSKFGAQIGESSYSQSFEFEADYVGLYVAARAGYDIVEINNSCSA